MGRASLCYSRIALYFLLEIARVPKVVFLRDVPDLGLLGLNAWCGFGVFELVERDRLCRAPRADVDALQSRERELLEGMQRKYGRERVVVFNPFLGGGNDPGEAGSEGSDLLCDEQWCWTYFPRAEGSSAPSSGSDLSWTSLLFSGGSGSSGTALARAHGLLGRVWKEKDVSGTGGGAVSFTSPVEDGTAPGEPELPLYWDWDHLSSYGVWRVAERYLRRAGHRNPFVEGGEE